jgi:hypothetical protein
MSPYSNKKITANSNVSKKNVLLVNFLGGIAWGLGSVIGATIIVAILVWLLNSLGLFTYVKDYLPDNIYIRPQIKNNN